MTAVRSFAALLALIAVAGCETGGMTGAAPTPPALFNAPAGVEPAPAGTGEELGAQSLEPGACGAFFWGMAEPHPFLVFANETEGFARVFANGAAHGFFYPPRSDRLIAGDRYDRRFQDDDRALEFHLSGEATSLVADGVRIERAVLRHHRPNGATLVTPLIGLFTCRGAD